jgi:hypothetical protein
MGSGECSTIKNFLVLYRSPNIVRGIKSRRLRWADHVGRLKEGRSTFKVLTGKPTENRPLGRPRRRWEDNVRMDFKEIDINTGNCVDSARDGIVEESL